MLFEEELENAKGVIPRGLNPCSNGICSSSQRWGQVPPVPDCLNPCSNGICSSRRTEVCRLRTRLRVLILVLMEYALREVQSDAYSQVSNRLNPCSNGICSSRANEQTGAMEQTVLILVLMEYALRARASSHAGDVSNRS